MNIHLSAIRKPDSYAWNDVGESKMVSNIRSSIGILVKYSYFQ